MFDNICSLPLSSDLFAQALHPTEPLLAVGLYSGHVETFRLPAAADADEEAAKAEDGFGKIDTAWRTRRHKGSCRSLGFSADGECADGVVKAASTATGRVTSKIAIPGSHAADAPTLLHALSPQTLLLATDSSALHLYDLRAPRRPAQTHRPHDDYISSLTPLPATAASTSGFAKQWLTTGGSTVAVTDLRRGVLVRSEDQEEELLSSAFVTGLPARQGRSSGEKAIVGGAGGVLTLWERGAWQDQEERIVVSTGRGGGESVDALVTLPEGMVGGKGRCVAAAMGDGTVKFVMVGGANKVLEEMGLSHDEVESVTCLGVDVGGRLISGGGRIVKVWTEAVERDEAEDEESELKRRSAQDSDDGSDEQDESSEEEVKRKKKRRRGKGREGDNGILGFKGLD